MAVSYISLLEKVENKIQDNKIELEKHLMICLEINSEGMPAGQVVKCSADPYEVLGMIDVAMHKLDDLRSNILSKFKKTEDISRKIQNGLPKEITDKLDEFEDALKRALESKDADALEDLKNKILGQIDNDSKDNKEDDDDFDIDTFKLDL